VAATGKPVVVVLLNGSALSVNLAAETADAILTAGYPGQQIEIYGYFDAQYFRGEVFFDNQYGAANFLGQFVVETCGFFRCY